MRDHDSQGNPDDLELWKRACNDKAAFKDWRARYHRGLLAFLKSICRPPLDPADIAQETWIKVWEHCHQWDPAKGSFISWLFRIARNLMFSELRKQKRHHVQPLIDEMNVKAPEPQEVSPRAVAVKECLEQLGGRFIEILKLRLHEKLNSRQIAERLGISVNSVDKGHFQGKQQIKDCVERKCR